jgi:hypothetical protein
LVEESDTQDDTPDPIFDAPLEPRHLELLNQKIRLTSGVEMPLNIARVILKNLRSSQDREPDEFAALVSMVNPKGTPQAPAAVSPEMLAALRKSLILRVDGTVAPEIAEVLKAAYLETDEGVVLRDPIVYPSRDFCDELASLDEKRDARLARLLFEERDKKRKRNDDDGQAR